MPHMSQAARRLGGIEVTLRGAAMPFLKRGLRRACEMGSAESWRLLGSNAANINLLQHAGRRSSARGHGRSRAKDRKLLVAGF